MLLGKQITRSHGVNGLFAAVFGEGVSEDETSLEKLEHIARVLLTVPQGTQPLVSSLVSRSVVLTGNEGFLSLHSTPNIVIAFWKYNLYPFARGCIHCISDVSGRGFTATR